jgi:endo-1,4-beta-xylanase
MSGQDGIDEANFTRRGAITGALALTACGASNRPSTIAEVRPLKSASSLPIGSAVTNADLADPTLSQLIVRNIGQVTPGWEMKMSAIIARDGGFRFTAADTIVAFAQQHKMAVHGHALVWHKHVPDAFSVLGGNPERFAKFYRAYILAATRRYAGQLRGWDVLNEPINHDGVGLRDSAWSQVLGTDEHMLLAFAHAAEGDPATPRFLNEYGLEKSDKRASFMRLVERLLAQGALIDGIGTQTHIDINLPRGALTATLRDLASFGLPIHVSELDISMGRDRLDTRSSEHKLATQAELASELVEAYFALPAPQRYAITFWGLRDRDSWLRQPPFTRFSVDRPSPFDDDGCPKPMARALTDALARQAAGSGKPG